MVASLIGVSEMVASLIGVSEMVADRHWRERNGCNTHLRHPPFLSRQRFKIAVKVAEPDTRPMTRGTVADPIGGSRMAVSLIGVSEVAT